MKKPFTSLFSEKNRVAPGQSPSPAPAPNLSNADKEPVSMNDTNTEEVIPKDPPKAAVDAAVDKEPVSADLADGPSAPAGSEEDIAETPDAAAAPLPSADDDTHVDAIVDNDSTDDPHEDLAEQLSTLESERDEFKDKFLRASAESENIRRRADQQRSNDRKYAIEAFARELLDVRDSLDHAGSVELDKDADASSKQMLEGLELTLKQMDAAMEKYKIEAIAPDAGNKFDPELHQAMTMQPVDDIAANHIVSTIRKGYRLHDRLLRPAMVVVSAGADSPATKDEADVTPAAEPESDDSGAAGDKT